MDNHGGKSRIEKMSNNILDAGADELTSVAIDATRAIIQEAKEWIIRKYNQVKSNLTADARGTLEDLELRIAISNMNVEIGMEKKEIAVLWAMKKLGYSEEQTQQVLDLANEAYQPKD